MALYIMEEITLADDPVVIDQGHLKYTKFRIEEENVVDFTGSMVGAVGQDWAVRVWISKEPGGKSIFPQHQSMASWNLARGPKITKVCFKGKKCTINKNIPTAEAEEGDYYLNFLNTSNTLVGFIAKLDVE